MHVAILLTTYNGERFLPQQLASFAAQTHTDWHLWVSDDGSTDGTLALLDAFAKHHPVTVLKGPHKGFVANFISLYARTAIDPDLLCFSDQDDIWMPEKLARCVEACGQYASEIPMLYCSKAIYTDEANNVLGTSGHFVKPAMFANALVQCIAGGNTMALNRAAHRLLQTAKDVPIISHDWWAYQLITGAGGVVHYDAEPMIEYRQHRTNIAGSNRGLRNALNRVQRMLAGQFRRWNDVQCHALQVNRALLTPDNQWRLDLYCAARKRSLIPRLHNLYSTGIYRQTLLGNVGLMVAALLKRI